MAEKAENKGNYHYPDLDNNKPTTSMAGQTPLLAVTSKERVRTVRIEHTIICYIDQKTIKKLNEINIPLFYTLFIKATQA